MRTREGAPASKQKAPTVPQRTTYQASTPRRFAHHLTLSDVVVWALFIALIALAELALCALIWLVA
jgi:hypothetical protein